MEKKGKIITCVECGQEFEFTLEEQEYYSKQGYKEPKRCPICRALKGCYRYVRCAGCGILMKIPLLTEVRKRRLYGEKYRPLKWCKACKTKRKAERSVVKVEIDEK